MSFPITRAPFSEAARAAREELTAATVAHAAARGPIARFRAARRLNTAARTHNRVIDPAVALSAADYARVTGAPV